MSDTQLSPILPHLNYASPPVTPPPRAHATSSPSDSINPTPSHQRSHSSVSFSIPRRPVNGGFVFEPSRSATSTPQRPQPARTRDSKSPSPSPSPAPPPAAMEHLVERVANAMLERDKLQEKIDDVVEKQYTFASSRPSSARGQASSNLSQGGEPLRQQNLKRMVKMEPMPEIPALPPNAPSFSERVSSDHVQSTPTQPPSRTRYEANSSRKIVGRAPPPPLPLRFRPPLRKKKSFSRVSSWLFPAGGGHKKEMSLDSFTNAPRPVADGQGFYQVAQLEPHRRSSFDTESTVSDWTVEEQTTLTSLSPTSVASPRSMAGPSLGRPFGLQEPIRFQCRTNVGVAF
ncbi:hypothetical protein NUW58_g8713 [Xylaria curta]|uniref:Uncharacterized protein n=1 Tax=Xylaria curta TaxID=42375 RepID=A0ACC1N5T8_9PEZI|nr:hypothetical protein NUW58_g8713 [Xylaria curta]